MARTPDGPPPPPVVRAAGPPDVARLAELRAAWDREAGGAADDPRFAAGFATWWTAQQPSLRTFLAEADGVALGMLSVFVVPQMPRPGRAGQPWGYVQTAYVRVGHRNVGIGTALLTAVRAYAVEIGLRRLVVRPRPASRAFWARAGFGSADELLLLSPVAV